MSAYLTGQEERTFSALQLIVSLPEWPGERFSSDLQLAVSLPDWPGGAFLLCSTAGLSTYQTGQEERSSSALQLGCQPTRLARRSVLLLLPQDPPGQCHAVGINSLSRHLGIM